MTAPPERFVIDASVAVKLFVKEPLSDEAHRLLRPDGRPGPRGVFVPEIFHVECANVFWKRARRRDLTEAVASRCFRDLLSLPFRVVSTIDQARSVLRMAFRLDLTAYDAAYVVAADLLRVPLITADEALTRRVPRGSLEVRWLGAIESA